MEDKVTHISAKHSLFNLKLREVWQYRDLILLFTKRSFQVTYQQTILGPLWLFLNPLMTATIYVILFGNIAKLSTDGVPQLLFYLSGNALWGYFSSCLSSNSSTFVGNAGLFGKVYFPRLVLPLSNILGSLLRFGIQLLPALVLLGYYWLVGAVRPHGWYCLAIPLVLLQVGLMGMGFGILLSALTTKYRDLSVLVGFGLQLWMYATPVVYPLSTVSGRLGQYLCFNPMTAPMELFRYAFVGSGTVLLQSLLLSLGATILVVLLGLVLFHKVERTFMDTV